MLNITSCSNSTTYNPAFLADIKKHFSPFELYHAIHNHQLTLQYQPRYDSKSGQFIMLEALVRWQHPNLDLLQPGEFISIAEEHSLIGDLGLWVFEQSCKDLIFIRKRLNHPIKIAVNVSLLQCEDGLHAQKMFAICQRYNLDLSDFEFELTESTNLKNSENVLHFCETIISLGAEVSLDDFGTGQSPLNNLCDLPVHAIKIDRYFTKQIGLGGRSETLIHHLVKLAHDMGMKVIAEGVENIYQRDQLIKMGCDQLQGFLMCRPLNPENLNKKNIEIQLYKYD